MPSDTIRNAVKSLSKGEFILIYDKEGREEEVDLVKLAEKVRPEDVYRMRYDAGGLICVAVHPEIWHRWELPFLHDLFRTCYSNYGVLAELIPNDIPYDEKSAFSVTVNHRKTFTGVTDVDRALTIRELGLLGRNTYQGNSDNNWKEELGRNFRSPGHVHLLLATDGLLKNRQGHTELTVSLAEIGNLNPVTVLCEMLDGKTGKALSINEAKKYAKKYDLVYVSGEEIIEEYAKRAGND
ncbi:MAG: 3,4-dihydroxy-2-butanone-4-phosphate synthase [Candidatus Jordarchaeum sp.]|uniref:3,4-dihydroxy-2-butanone-4-phosphate synthase n=1 Tax=Candidatus Jordarchaeum sp. TaxID=2823881 RepID=UPI004049C3F0